MLYASAGILAIIISLIINNDILFKKDTADSIVPAHNYYRYYLFSVLAFYFSDVLWGILYDNGLIQLAFVDTLVYFITMAGSVWLWTRYVVEYLEGNNAPGRLLKAIGCIFFAFVTISQVVNCFSPVVFYFSENGDYQVSFVRNIIMGVQIALFLITGIYVMVAAAGKSEEVKLRHQAIGLSSIAMGVSIVAQVYYPLLPNYSIGSMIAGCLLHSFVIEAVKKEYHQKLEQEQSENSRLEKELESQSELAELMGSMSSLLVNMPAMTFSKDVETGKYLACNQAFAEYAGKKAPEEVVGLTDHDLFDKATADHFVEDDKKTIMMKEPNVYFEDVPDAAGTNIRNLQTTKQKFTDATGRLCLLGMGVDVTETAKVKAEQARMQEIELKHEMEEQYKKNVEELSFRATHDELTGIYNRLGYEHIMKKVDLSECYMLLFDADDFKTINDTYGHEVGDKVLIKITTALKNNFRADDYIFRIGGDEFIVIMTHISRKLEKLVAAKIEEINRELSETKDGIPAVSMSVGVVHGSGDESDSNLFSEADRAMYEAKKGGKHSYRFA